MLALVPLALGLAERLLGWAEKRAESDSNIRIQELKARSGDFQEAQETLRTFAVTSTERQQTKMSWAVFWALIVAIEGPGILSLWMIWIYNFLWWENGVWPQPWALAAFPPQAEAWVDMAIRWLFDPVGQVTTIGSAAGAGWIAGRRQ